MSKQTITISNIFSGQMPSANFGGNGEFLTSIGIDPDVPTTDDASDIKTGGFIRPVAYAAFSGAEITSSPIAILTNPKDTNIYVVLSDGNLVSYDNNLENPTVIGRVQEGVEPVDVEARGAWYYNNYIYIATPHDVASYGPLNDTPSLVSEVWTSATLGSQDVLVDSDYPVTLFNLGYLNHFGFTHIDNQAYFCDYSDGIGYLHTISTDKGTYEGDTDAGSTYGVLDLPFGYFPIVASSYGNDIVISATPTSDTDINQGNARLFFWDTTSVSFYRSVMLPDPICSVLKYINGILYGLSGSLNGGYRLFRYVGGDAIETLKIIEDGNPPLQNASDFAGNRIVWAANTTYPFVTSGIMAYGSKSDLFPKGLHHIGVSGFI